MSDKMTITIAKPNQVDFNGRVYRASFQEINDMIKKFNARPIGEFFTEDIKPGTTRFCTTEMSNAAMEIGELRVEGTDDDFVLKADIYPYALLETMIKENAPIHFALRGLMNVKDEMLKLISIDVVSDSDQIDK